MHPLQLADRYVWMSRSGAEVRAPDDELQVPDVTAVVQHVGRHGVPQQMTGAHGGPTRKVAAPVRPRTGLAEPPALLLVPPGPRSRFRYAGQEVYDLFLESSVRTGNPFRRRPPAID